MRRHIKIKILFISIIALLPKDGFMYPLKATDSIDDAKSEQIPRNDHSSSGQEKTDPPTKKAEGPNVVILVLCIVAAAALLIGLGVGMVATWFATRRRSRRQSQRPNDVETATQTLNERVAWNAASKDEVSFSDEISLRSMTLSQVVDQAVKELTSCKCNSRPAPQ